MNRLTRFPLLGLLLFAVFSASAANVEEIQSPAAAGSLAPSIATLADGRLVLTWIEPCDAGHALKFSVLDDGGFGPAKTIARGEDWFANWADTPGLFVLPGGDWIAHWLVKSGESTYAYDVKLARSADGGENWSDALSPHHDGTQTEHGFVSYYAESRDGVGVVWLDGRRMAREPEGEGTMTLRTAVLESDNSLVDEALLDERVCDCCQTASAMTSEGPIVVYRDRSEDEIRDHFVVRRTSEGWTEPRRLHADNWRIGGCPVNGPAIVAEGERVAVAWFAMPNDEPRVSVAVSEDGGRSFQPVDILGEGSALGRVDLALSDEGFVLSWVDQSEAGGVLALVGYQWRGLRTWQTRIDGLEAGRASGFPRLGIMQGCRPVVAWTGRVDGERRVRVARVESPGGCDEPPGS